MRILAIDLGNSRTHAAIVADGSVVANGATATAPLKESAASLTALFRELAEKGGPPDALSFGSVVPAATGAIEQAAQDAFGDIPHYHLCIASCPIPVDGPRGIRETGDDILANAVAAWKRFGPPAVVIDMGTATTLDLIRTDGYCGSIIAPGLAMMTDYLHEKTAQLPRLYPGEALPAVPVGQSTREAMLIGFRAGFGGMISGLVEHVRLHLPEGEAAALRVIATGGAADVLTEPMRKTIAVVPHFTLLGLADAWELHSQATPTP